MAHGWGACVARGKGHAWQGACVVGGMHGGGGHVWWGACMVEGACVAGGMHGGGHACGGHVWQGGMHGGGVHATADNKGYSQ